MEKKTVDLVLWHVTVFTCCTRGFGSELVRTNRCQAGDAVKEVNDFRCSLSLFHTHLKVQFHCSMTFSWLRFCVFMRVLKVECMQWRTAEHPFNLKQLNQVGVWRFAANITSTPTGAGLYNTEGNWDWWHHYPGTLKSWEKVSVFPQSKLKCSQQASGSVWCWLVPRCVIRSLSSCFVCCCAAEIPSGEGHDYPSHTHIHTLTQIRHSLMPTSTQDQWCLLHPRPSDQHRHRA